LQLFGVNTEICAYKGVCLRLRIIAQRLYTFFAAVRLLRITIFYANYVNYVIILLTSTTLPLRA
jgi:hypothetical protein